MKGFKASMRIWEIQIIKQLQILFNKNMHITENLWSVTA